MACDQCVMDARLSQMVAYIDSNGRTRYRILRSAPRHTVNLTHKVVIKISGKSGIPAETRGRFAKDKILQAVVALAAKEDLVLVFDTYSYEPTTSPFSEVIHDLSPYVHSVMAVKRNDGKHFSKEFVEGWSHVTNLFVVEVDEGPNEWTTRHSRYVLHLYSGGDCVQTTGCNELTSQMNGRHVDLVDEGVVLIHMISRSFTMRVYATMNLLLKRVYRFARG